MRALPLFDRIAFRRLDAVALATLAIGMAALAAAALAMIQSPYGPSAVSGRVETRIPGAPDLPVPIVEAPVLIPVASDEARALNAANPIVAGPLFPSRPFIFAGSAEVRRSAATCLAAAVLYEAGDDKTGEEAVAQVVLNRVRHPAFPKTVCGVVFQGSERQTGCQFTFTCDGALARVPSPAAWARARLVADAALSGTVFKAVGTATHYHTNWVVPYWRTKLDKIAQVDTHLFYRWQGWWGTPAAFRGSLQPAERMDPRIAALAGPAVDAGAPGAADQGGIVAGAVGEGSAKIVRAALDIEGVPASVLKGNIVRLSDPAAGVFVLQLDPAAYPGSYAILAFKICTTKLHCTVMGWTSEDQLPSGLPISPVERQTVAFQYSKGKGDVLANWDCRRFPRDTPDQCLPGTAGRQAAINTDAAIAG